MRVEYQGANIQLMFTIVCVLSKPEASSMHSTCIAHALMHTIQFMRRTQKNMKSAHSCQKSNGMQLRREPLLVHLKIEREAIQ